MWGVLCEVRPKFFYRSASPVKWLIMSFFFFTLGCNEVRTHLRLKLVISAFGLVWDIMRGK